MTTDSNKEPDSPAAEQFYQSLLVTGLAESAKNIWRACDIIEQTGKGTIEIRVSEVGRICKEHFGGPTAQSIRNQKDTLKKLVDIRADALLVVAKHFTPGSSAHEIADPNTAALVRVLEERIRQLTQSNRRLRSAFKNLDPSLIRIIEDEHDGLRIVSNPNNSFAEPVSDIESESLRAFLRLDHLQAFGLNIDDKERIVEGRTVLMEKAALRAIRRLISN